MAARGIVQTMEDCACDLFAIGPKDPLQAGCEPRVMHISSLVAAPAVRFPGPRRSDERRLTGPDVVGRDSPPVPVHELMVRSVLNGCGPQEIAAIASQHAGGPVAVVTTLMGEVAAGQTAPDPAGQLAVLRAWLAERRRGRPAVVPESVVAAADVWFRSEFVGLVVLLGAELAPPADAADVNRFQANQDDGLPVIVRCREELPRIRRDQRLLVLERLDPDHRRFGLVSNPGKHPRLGPPGGATAIGLSLIRARQAEGDPAHVLLGDHDRRVAHRLLRRSGRIARHARAVWTSPCSPDTSMGPVLRGNRAKIPATSRPAVRG